MTQDEKDWLDFLGRKSLTPGEAEAIEETLTARKADEEYERRLRIQADRAKTATAKPKVGSANTGTR